MNQADMNAGEKRDPTRPGAVFLPFPGVSTFSLLLAVSVFLFVLLPADAQLYTGSVAGTVTDPSKASIPSAHLALVDELRGLSFTAATDGDGRYVLRPIPPGSYRISVDAPGFQAQRKEGIKLAVNQNLEIDFSLKVGTATEVLEVKERGEALATQDAVTGQVVDRRLINDLPLIDRGVLNLTLLTPGVTEVDTQSPGFPQNNFISNGSRNATADMLTDGVTTTNFEQNGGVLSPTYTPSVDAVEEFKVQQSNFSAEFGFSGATIINLITRSGTNKFHGSAYEFLRNQIFDANDWFANKNGNKIPPLRRNNFGATVGGPIRKNKTFFFGDYEGLRQRNFASANAGVPTMHERTGDFSELCTIRAATFVNGVCTDPAGQIWDPYSGMADQLLGAVRSTPIPNNNLALYASPGNPALNATPSQVRNPGTAGNLIDPVALKLMQMFPTPTITAQSFAELSNNWFGSGVARDDRDQFDIKVDHSFSDHDLLSVKYSQQRENSHSFNCFHNVSDPCNQGPIKGTAHLVAINHTHTFKPSLVLSVSYGLTRGAFIQPGIRADFPTLDPVVQLGLPAYMDVSGIKQFPSIQLTGYNQAAGSAIGTLPFTFLREGTETHALSGGVSWLRGNHEFKFGAESRLHRINFTNPGWTGGQFQFDFSATSQNTATSTGAGGDALASFLIGIGPMSQAQPNACNCVYEVPNVVSTQSLRFGGYVQDNWRVKPKLTLNLGMRYEVSLPRTERFNRMNWLDPNLSFSLPAGPNLPPGAPPLPVRGGEVFLSPHHRYNYDTDFKNIQPRLGFAYQLPHAFVLRAGYGIYFSTPRSGASGTGPWGFQGYDQQTTWIPTFQNSAVLPGARLSDPFPGAGPKLPPGNSLGSLNDIGFDAVGPLPGISTNTPYEQAWTFGFQKELPARIVVDASYVGKKGTHLYFGGFRQMNHLGPAAGLMTPAQIQDPNSGLLRQVPNPFFGYITDPLSQLSGPTIAEWQTELPFPQFTGFLGDSPPIANSIYHALQVRFEKSFSNGLQFLVTYVYAKSIDTASTTDDSVAFFGGTLPGGTIIQVQNPNNTRLERAVSTWDIPQVLQFSYAYELPFGKGRRFGSNWHPVLNAILGGWQTNGIWRFASGRPILPSENTTIAIPTYGQRPTLTEQLQHASGSPGRFTDPGKNYFSNPGALVVTAPFTLGNAPRTITRVRQPGMRNATMSMMKEFPLSKVREGMRLEYRFEAFNAFNHPYFNGPDSAVDSPTFGQILNMAGSSREVQMALKFYW